MNRFVFILGCTLLGMASMAQAQTEGDSRLGDALNQASRQATTIPQLSRGNWVVGGTGTLGLNVTGNSENAETDDGSTTFGLNGLGGYFFTDQFVGGLNLNWTVVNQESGRGDLTNSTFTIGPFVRYYLPISENIAVYPQVSIGFGSASTETLDPVTSAIDDNDSSVFSWGIGVGAGYFIGDQVSIDLFLGFNRLSSSQDVATAAGSTVEVDTDRNTFGANVGFSFYF